MLEIIATGLFVMVILTVATDERAAWNGVMAPFLIGLFIFTAATVVGPASGGSFNPARSLDPVLYNQDWSDVWIYIVGPLAGGVLGAAIWAFLCLRKPPVPGPELEVARGGLEPFSSRSAPPPPAARSTTERSLGRVGIRLSLRAPGEVCADRNSRSRVPISCSVGVAGSEPRPLAPKASALPG